MPSTLSLVLPDREGMVLPNGRLHPDFRRYLLNLGEVATNLSELGGDHGTIGGLSDDDHSQYHNDARGDARYSQLGHTHAYEPELGNPAADGYVLSSTAAGARSWVAQAGGGAAAPYCHLTKSGTQDVGGANGTVTYIDWDGTQINVDTGFTHSTVTNPSRVQVDADGRYQLIATVGIDQGGSARTTSMIEYRVNGTTIVTRGRARNYSRGSAYGDASCNLVTEMDLSNGDYIEVSITVDDTDGTYTNNTINAECELILRKVA